MGGTRAALQLQWCRRNNHWIYNYQCSAGYSAANPPQILVEVPKSRREEVGVDSYFGDQGIIVGVAQSAGALGTLELYIPQDSYMRDPNIVGTAITLSTVQEGDLFVVNLSHFGLSTNTSDGIYRACKT